MGSPIIIVLKKQETENKKSHTCHVCCECFEDTSAFDEHLKIHTEETNLNLTVPYNSQSSKSNRNPFNCGNCNRTFFLERTFRYHCCSNLVDRPHDCPLCTKRFSKRKLLLTHLRTHDKRFKCEMCDKAFANNASFITHLRRHSGELPYVCKMCYKKFPNSHYLQLHINTHKKPYKCTYCDASFALKQKLVDHTREHEGQENYTCMFCTKSFIYKAYLERHQCPLDPNNPYKCEKCGKTFSLQHSLKAHALSHTEEKTYKCDLCPKSFIRKSYLDKHYFYHSENKPLSCDVCHKRFNWQHELKRHELVHIPKWQREPLKRKLHLNSECKKKKIRKIKKEKTVQCDICFKFFAGKYYARRHRVIHFNNKTHKCNVCNKSFLRKYELTNHRIQFSDAKMHEKLRLKVRQAELAKMGYRCEKCKEYFSYQISLDYHRCK